MLDSQLLMRNRPNSTWRGPLTLRTFCWFAAGSCMGLFARSSIAADSSIRFSRDIRPIFSDTCFACHGPDQKARKAGLRLDTKEGLYESAPKHGPAVVPGNLAKSELWQRIISSDPEEQMPPPDSHKTLSADQKDKIKRWIEDGALWQGHWAFLKPERPPVPAVKSTGSFTIRNPIDAFVLARLQAKGLRPAPEADRRTLARRATLDLTGLPPRPETLEAFLGDHSPNAYHRLIKQLLNSPQWGEHRARYWLDAARYADTHGLHFDNYREIWPYREWVIGAFNRNTPFDRFTIQQIAGDLLPDATDDDRIATGFHRCNLTTNEGGTIEDENLANYANDRVTTTSWVWLGLTLNCAACHDHKFDPLTTRDFYSMAAFFRNTKQSGFDKNRRETDLFMVVPQTETDRARWKALLSELESAKQQRDTEYERAGADFTNWLPGFQASAAKAVTFTNAVGSASAPSNIPMTLPDAALHLPLTEGQGSNLVGSVTGYRTDFIMSGSLSWQADAPYGSAPLFSEGNSVLLGDFAGFEAGEPFSGGAWVKLPKTLKSEGSVLARMAGEDAKHRGWDLYVREGSFGFQLSHRWSIMAMAVRANDKTLRADEWQHVFFTYDGSGRASGVKLFVNGLEVGANRDQNGLEGSIRNSLPLRVGRREKGNQLVDVAVQDIQIYSRRLATNEVRALATAAPSRFQALLADVRAHPTNNAPGDALRDWFMVTQHSGWQHAQARFAALEKEQQLIRGRSPVTLIQEEKTNSQPMAAILFRGQYDQPREKVAPATPAVLHPLPSGAPRNRLGLAEWLVAPDNPLTARVVVNRFWQEVFGTGLVKSTEDFGATGETPSHPELLDWLAVEFQENGWDVKRLFELILTSSTYRQSAVVTPDKIERDPQNRLLSRGPRFRMDAEMVRDYALAAADLLALKVGGPSVKPYQPAGVWEAVAMPESNTGSYRADQGENLYRRSVYTFWKRAAPPPTMDLFNAPSRETCAVRRERTNTPLQALATLNDPQFVEAARHLAEIALTRAQGRDDTAVAIMARRLLMRPLTAAELAIVKHTLTDMTRFYQKNPDAAQALIQTGESTAAAPGPASQLAALTMVANQLLNLDEVLNK